MEPQTTLSDRLAFTFALTNRCWQRPFSLKAFFKSMKLQNPELESFWLLPRLNFSLSLSMVFQRAFFSCSSTRVECSLARPLGQMRLRFTSALWMSKMYKHLSFFPPFPQFFPFWFSGCTVNLCWALHKGSWDGEWVEDEVFGRPCIRAKHCMTVII